MLQCKYCSKTHRTYHAVAKCKFPWALWIDGEGEWGSMAWCERPDYRGSTLTIQLYKTREAAEKAKQWIDEGGCGGSCYKDHTIWNFHCKEVRRNEQRLDRTDYL